MMIIPSASSTGDQDSHQHWTGYKGSGQVPDATTLLHFRHLLEQHNLGAKLLQSQRETFAEQGWILRGGNILDATNIATPSSTKDADGARDPDLRQTKKGHQWYFRRPGPS